MRRYLLGILVICTIFMMTGCKKEATKNESEIVSFAYFYGSYNEGYYDYKIDGNGDKVKFTGNGLNGVKLNINKTIDRSYLDELATIINENGIYEWNGFSGKASGISDGYSFTLEIVYLDGKVFKASGIGKYPKNYDSGHKIMAEFLNSID